MADPTQLAIIGGGISGLALALEASEAGLSVALFERGSLCSGASGNSLRIIHGGLRYLQELNLARVIEAIRAQREFLTRFREFVEPLPCLMPLAARGLKSRIPVIAGASLYRGISGVLRSPSEGARVVSPEWVRAELPLLADLAQHGALLWYDALLLDPEGFISYLVSRIVASGGRVEEHWEIVGVARQGGYFELAYRRAGGEGSVRATRVINASGASLYSNPLSGSESLVPSGTIGLRAFNLVLRKQLSSEYAFAIGGDEGRLLFVTPRGGEGGRSAIGTWYLPLSGSKEEPGISEQELANCLTELNRRFPEGSIELSDIEDVECGILPARRDSRGREELLGSSEYYTRGGYIEILSTKYTTAFVQARSILNASYGRSACGSSLRRRCTARESPSLTRL